MPRIISGTLGGRTIPGPPGKGTRPTSDRVREALFSRLDGWDAVAGPGPDPIRLSMDAVILAVPATPAARLLRDVEPDPAEVAS